MSNQTICPITGLVAAEIPGSNDSHVISCAALGGEYEVTGTAAEMLSHLMREQRLKVATFVLEQRRLGAQRPRISSKTLDEVANARPLSAMEKVHRLYRYIANKSPVLGTRLPTSGLMTPELKSFVDGACAWTESLSESELIPLYQFGKEAGHLADIRGVAQLTVKGWSYVEQLEATEKSSIQAFVAMWFGPEVSSAYEEGIAPAIRQTGYVPMRIDQKEHANRIDDEIIAEIRRSRFVVADFTCGLVDDGGKPVAIPRGGVYYEAGFAQGLGIPVIWMCREDHINHVHFDTRQFNHITWKDAADLREKLQNRIGAVLGDGPNISR